MQWDKFIEALSDEEATELSHLLSKRIAARGLTQAEIQLISGGLMIEAIKSVRNRLSITLKEALELCNAYKKTLEV